MSEEQQILPIVDLSSASPLRRRPNPNHFLKNMKPVPVDVGLEFHEKLITKVDKSLRATKFRLHQTELLLNLEPPPDEANHHVDWIATIDDMLSSNHRLNFPSFSSLQKQHEFNQLVKKQSKTHERAQSRQEWNRRAALILAKETQNIQKKVLAGKCTFGSSAKGVSIKTISDYSGKQLCLTSCDLLLIGFFLGCNTFDKESRTLVRKEGRIQPEDREHNLPDWFCPQYYDSNKYDPKKKHDNSYQIPFKSPERYPQFSEELLNREHVKRRRKELAALKNNETKQSLSASNLLMSSKDQTLPRPAITANNNNSFPNKRVSMISDLDEDEYDSESMIDSVDELEGEGTEEGSSGQSSLNKMNRRLQKLRKSILMENSSTNGDSTASTASYSIDFSENSIGKLLDKYDTAVTRKASEQLMRRKSRSPTQQATRLSMLPLPDQRHLKKLQKNQQLQEEQYQQRKMSQSSSISEQPRNSIYHRPSTVLSPIEAHHSYALKILDGSDPTKQKGWKPKDYTLEALKYQKPIEFSTFFIEDTFDDPAALLPVTSPVGIANNPSVATTQAPSTVSHHNSHHSGSTTVLKYSSDVFRLKPGAHYKSSDVLLREMDEKIKLRTQAEVQAQTVQKHQRRMTTPGTAPTAGNQSLGNTSHHHQHNSVPITGNEGGTEDLQGGVGGGGGESPKRQHSALTSPTLGIGENNLSFESLSLETKSQVQDYSFQLLKNNSKKAMTLIDDDTMTAPMTKHLTLSTEELLYSPSSIKNRLLRPQLGSPTVENHTEQPSDSNFTKFLNKWYDENDIIRYKYSKKQEYSLYSGPRLPSSDGTTIHESSMDKSLKGLLLQENPYLTKEKQEELIKNHKLRDIGDVEV
jgi:hypothetical protein